MLKTHRNSHISAIPNWSIHIIWLIGLWFAPAPITLFPPHFISVSFLSHISLSDLFTISINCTFLLHTRFFFQLIICLLIIAILHIYINTFERVMFRHRFFPFHRKSSSSSNKRSHLSYNTKNYTHYNLRSIYSVLVFFTLLSNVSF